jgi:hypothetical protein
MPQAVKVGKPDRVVYSTADSYSTAERLRLRGVRARVVIYRKQAFRNSRDEDVEAWGWTVVQVAEGGKACYVSMGVPCKAPSGADFHLCMRCEYADATLIGNSTKRCAACRHEIIAWLGLRVQRFMGVELGWKRLKLGEVWKEALYGGLDLETGMSVQITERSEKQRYRNSKRAGYESDAS